MGSLTRRALGVPVMPSLGFFTFRLQLDFVPLAYILMLGSSYGFSMPVGYQTHMMVQGPGGCKFSRETDANLIGMRRKSIDF